MWALSCYYIRIETMKVGVPFIILALPNQVMSSPCSLKLLLAVKAYTYTYFYTNGMNQNSPLGQIIMSPHDSGYLNTLLAAKMCIITMWARGASLLSQAKPFFRKCNLKLNIKLPHFCKLLWRLHTAARYCFLPHAWVQMPITKRWGQFQPNINIKIQHSKQEGTFMDMMHCHNMPAIRELIRKERHVRIY